MFRSLAVLSHFKPWLYRHDNLTIHVGHMTSLISKTSFAISGSYYTLQLLCFSPINVYRLVDV